ncbi:MAG: 4Fe-4S binding protein [Oscillospiraceae bacterium]|nr:4Fe-4S binding protein [Oscillospiraceae bacterium]
MPKVFVIDIARCSGCYNCQLACKDENCFNDWMPYARPQPAIGQFWCKVHEHPEGTIPKVKIHYVSQMCAHCDEPACREACPAGAVTKRADGLVLIDPAACTGCGACMEACPYDAIFKNEELGICQKCTGCAHLLDHGAKLPRCAEACPTDAMRFGEKEEFAEELKHATVLHPEVGPNVYYLNMPGRFLAGTLYDAEEQEVLIGARVTCVGEGLELETVTDDFGDYWFKDLPDNGTFTVTAEMDGYRPLTFADVTTDVSRNLGDTPMEKL